MGAGHAWPVRTLAFFAPLSFFPIVPSRPVLRGAGRAVVFSEDDNNIHKPSCHVPIRGITNTSLDPTMAAIVFRAATALALLTTTLGALLQAPSDDPRAYATAAHCCYPAMATSAALAADATSLALLQPRARKALPARPARTTVRSRRPPTRSSPRSATRAPRATPGAPRTRSTAARA